MFQRVIFKYSIAFATLLLTFMIFGSTVMANEDISDQETLEEQIKELNERLEAGEEIFIVERELSFTDEPAQVEINSGNTQVSGEFGIMSTTRSANFKATL
ncbi:hypothetical protein [Alkalihalobacterium bogoriense]|uniref:hypothetical protein n=1 Tax=Alkalihalobacterium bogoriense TaxID=246272 RepID=UPI00047D8B88|nr:hypothetical protein [Alkalihalobacterium bogoriense]